MTKVKKLEFYLFIGLSVVNLFLKECFKPIIQNEFAKKQIASPNFIPTIPTFVFSKIPAGKFIMGSPRNEPGRWRFNNEDQVSVEITKPFEITTTEVTFKQWFLIMGDNPLNYPDSPFTKFEDMIDCDNYEVIHDVKICPDHPVHSVSWNDVQEYIKKLNNILKLKGCNGTPQSSSGCYRLPTEAEWEYAVRAGTKTAYFFGDDASNLKDYAWYQDYLPGTDFGHRKVGLKKANPWGLYDVYGNIDEWVQDGMIGEGVNFIDRLWGHAMWDYLPGGKDPLIKELPPLLDKINKNLNYPIFVLYRIARGGNCYDGEVQNLRSAHRSFTPADVRHNIGFRLVRTL